MAVPRARNSEETQRGENLEGPRLDDRRTIPHLRLGPLVDEDMRHAAASEFNCKHKTRRTSADNENGIHGLPLFEIALVATFSSIERRPVTTYSK
jgi:hypothetical protein